MESGEQYRELNKKYFDLFEKIELINNRFSNMYLTMTENKKNIRKCAETISQITELLKLKKEGENNG